MKMELICLTEDAEQDYSATEDDQTNTLGDEPGQGIFAGIFPIPFAHKLIPYHMRIKNLQETQEG